MVGFAPEPVDNETLRKIRDISEKTNRQSNSMFWLTILIAILSINQILLFLLF